MAKPQAAEKECSSSAQPPFINTVGVMNYAPQLQRTSRKGALLVKSYSAAISSNERKEETRAVDNGPRWKKKILQLFALNRQNVHLCQVHREQPRINQLSFQTRSLGDAYLEKFAVCNLVLRALGLKSNNQCSKPGSAIHWPSDTGKAFVFLVSDSALGDKGGVGLKNPF